MAVVEECACADSRCRREDYFQAFWEVETQINADGNESRVIVKDKVQIQLRERRGKGGGGGRKWRREAGSLGRRREKREENEHLSPLCTPTING